MRFESDWDPWQVVSAKRGIVKHFLASLAYRTQKALRDAPPSFGTFQAIPGMRSPHQIVRHMNDVLNSACRFFAVESQQLSNLRSFEAEVARFHNTLQELGDHIETETPRKGMTLERILQGPLADAMTHAGQLAMLRRISGSPVAPENFMEATIRADNLGPQQPEPASPDEEWLDSDGKPQGEKSK